MVVDELERQVAVAQRAGKTPIMVNAMCGTTVLGAVDPLEEVADVCRKHGIWMHVDVSLATPSGTDNDIDSNAHTHTKTTTTTTRNKNIYCHKQ